MRVLTRCRLEKKTSKPPNKQLQNYAIGINNPYEIENSPDHYFFEMKTSSPSWTTKNVAWASNSLPGLTSSKW